MCVWSSLLETWTPIFIPYTYEVTIAPRVHGGWSDN